MSDSSALSSFWFLKLHALTTIRDFDGLEAFAKSRRSPIGYEAFVKHLVDKGYQKEALSSVPRCDGPKRADLYVLCNDWRAAAKECKDRNDKSKLEWVPAIELCLRECALTEGPVIQTTTEIGSKFLGRKRARAGCLIHEVVS